MLRVFYVTLLLALVPPFASAQAVQPVTTQGSLPLVTTETALIGGLGLVGLIAIITGDDDDDTASGTSGTSGTN